jgi:hypothetical protein
MVDEFDDDDQKVIEKIDEPATLVERIADVTNRTESFIRASLGWEAAGAITDNRAQLEQMAAGDDPGGWARKLLDEQIEIDGLMDAQKTQREAGLHAQQEDVIKAQVRARVERELAEAAEREAEARFEKEIRAELAVGAGGADPAEPLLQEFGHLKVQLDQELDAEKQEVLRERLTEISAEIDAGDSGGRIEFDVDAFEAEMGRS